MNLYSKNLSVALFFATSALAVALSSLQSPSAGAHQHKAGAPSAQAAAVQANAANAPAAATAIPGPGVADPEAPFADLAAPANPRASAQFALAMREFKAGRRTAAFGMFMRLADDGDAEAARVALLMVRYGSELYGAGWGASQEQIDYWLAVSRKPMPRFLAESGD